MYAKKPPQKPAVQKKREHNNTVRQKTADNTGDHTCENIRLSWNKITEKPAQYNYTKNAD